MAVGDLDAARRAHEPCSAEPTAGLGARATSSTPTPRASSSSILAIVGITGEWRHRTITSSLLAAPGSPALPRRQDARLRGGRGRALAGDLRRGRGLGLRHPARPRTCRCRRSASCSPCRPQRDRSRRCSALSASASAAWCATSRSAIVGVLAAHVHDRAGVISVLPEVGPFGPFMRPAASASRTSRRGDVGLERARRCWPRAWPCSACSAWIGAFFAAAAVAAAQRSMMSSSSSTTRRRPMRKVVMGMMTTLNGRLDDPAAWATGVPDDLFAELDRLYGTFDTILVGRTTYDEMFEYWPGAETDGGRLGAQQEHGPEDELLQEVRVHRRRARQTPLEWSNAEQVPVHGDEEIVAFVNGLKAQAGRRHPPLGRRAPGADHDPPRPGRHVPPRRPPGRVGRRELVRPDRRAAPMKLLSATAVFERRRRPLLRPPGRLISSWAARRAPTGSQLPECTCSSGPSCCLSARIPSGTSPSISFEFCQSSRVSVVDANVLGRGVQWLSTELVRVRPMGRKDLVGPATEHEVEEGRHRLSHRRSASRRPSSRTTSRRARNRRWVLLRAARRLHDAVEGHEGVHDQLSHLRASSRRGFGPETSSGSETHRSRPTS